MSMDLNFCFWESKDALILEILVWKYSTDSGGGGGGRKH